MFNRFRSFVVNFWMASIRRQLILGIALVHAALMTVFVIDLVNRQSDFLYEQSISQAEGLAKTMATSSSSWVLAQDVIGLDEVLQSQASFPGLHYAMVISPQGKVIAHTDNNKNNLYLSDPTSRQIFNSVAQPLTLVSNASLVDIAYPIMIDEDLIGWARVGIGQERIAEGLLNISRNGVLYTLLAIFIGSVFAYFMAKSLTGGLRHLVGVAEGNRMGQRDMRVNINREDEIGLLGKDFNLMLDALSQQEKEIRDREAELRKIADVLPAPVARVDFDGRYLFVSAAYERWFGKRPEDVVGKSQRESVSPEHYAKVEPYFERALSGEKVTFELDVKAPNKDSLYGQVTALPDFNSDGVVCGYYIIVADITERKIAENRLQKSQQQSKNYLDVAAVMLISVDPQGCVSLINNKGCEMLGLPEKDILGKNWFDHFLPKHTVKDVKVVFDQLMIGEIKGFDYYENIVITGNNEERLFAWNNSILFDDNGKTIGLLSSAEDITERRAAEKNQKLLQEQLIQSTKMEAVGHLTAGIAHDFNNILGVIMGYAELSKNIIKPDTPNKLSGYIDKILLSGTRATELVTQMLTFGRLSHTVDGEQPPATQLTPVVKEVISLLRSSLPSTISLNYEITDADIQIHIEPIQLHQIILNLGINARDAINEYGNINISIAKEHINKSYCNSCHHQFEGDFVKIKISDTGSGIDKEIAKNIFNPFFTTKEVGKGTGMGLSVVHGLVHRIGGHILLETVPGDGTTVCIMLPASLNKNEEDKTSATVASSSNKITGSRIMVVDDEQSIAELMSEFLTMNGSQVSIFNSPIAAWEYFEKNYRDIDIVITDETMPNLTGMHLAKRMLDLNPSSSVILCTGYSELVTSEIAEQAGLVGFLYKPVALNTLLEKIKTILSEKN